MPKTGTIACPEDNWAGLLEPALEVRNHAQAAKSAMHIRSSCTCPLVLYMRCSVFPRHNCSAHFHRAMQAVGAQLTADDISASRSACKQWAEVLVAAIRKIVFTCEPGSAAALEHAARHIAKLTSPATIELILSARGAPPEVLVPLLHLIKAATARAAVKHFSVTFPTTVPAQDIQEALQFLADTASKALSITASSLPDTQQSPLNRVSDQLLSGLQHHTQIATVLHSLALPLHLSNISKLLQLSSLQHLHLSNVPSFTQPEQHQLQTALNTLTALRDLRSLSLPWASAPQNNVIVEVPQWPHMTQFRLLPAQTRWRGWRSTVRLSQHHSSTLCDLQVLNSKVEVRRWLQLMFQDCAIDRYMHACWQQMLCGMLLCASPPRMPAATAGLVLTCTATPALSCISSHPMLPTLIHPPCLTAAGHWRLQQPGRSV